MKKKIFIAILGLVSYISIQAQEAWTLKDCIDYAIENNLEVKKQEAAKKLREIQLSTSKNSRLPNLNANAGQDFNFGRGLNDKNTYIDKNTQYTGFNLSTEIPLFTGFQIPNNIASNKLDLKAAIEDLNQIKENISIRLTTAFLEVLFKKELHKIALEQVNISKEQYERLQRLLEIGKASTSEVYEAKARWAQDELAETEAENNRNLALLDLTQFLELPSPEGFDIIAPNDLDQSRLPETPEVIYSEAVSSRPVIWASEYRLESAEKMTLIAKSNYYPKLSFNAGISTQYYHISDSENLSFGKQIDNNFTKFIGFRLSIPIFNRFDTRNKVRNARVEESIQKISLDQDKKDLYKEIQQAFYNAVAAQSKKRSSQIAMEANEAAFRLIKEKFENGKATLVEFNEIKMNLLKATSENIQAKYEHILRLKILDLYRGIPLSL